jgi:hypothetical protein
MADQEVVIVGADGTEHIFPPGFDPKRAAAIVKGGDAKSDRPSDSGGGAVLAGAKTAQALAPTIQQAAEAFATSPTAAKTGGALARGVTTIAALGQGLYSGNLNEVVSAPIKGWAAGKGGYFLTKALQAGGKPVAAAAEAAVPVARAFGNAVSPQGMLDLAQMAEPDRRDIGFMGIGASMPDLEVLTKAVAKGANPASAAAAITKGDPKKFGPLMAAYLMQTRAAK